MSTELVINDELPILAELAMMAEEYNSVSPGEGDLLIEASEVIKALYSALGEMLAIADDSRGVAGYHLNGDVADWGQFEEIDKAIAAMSKAGGRSINIAKTIVGIAVLTTMWLLLVVLAVDAIEFQQTWACQDCILLQHLRPSIATHPAFEVANP